MSIMDFEKEYMEIIEEIREEEEKNYIPNLKKQMDDAWNKYCQSQIDGTYEDLDDEYFICQTMLEDVGVKYDSSNKKGE